jgi:hypothetical protein
MYTKERNYNVLINELKAHRQLKNKITVTLIDIDYLHKKHPDLNVVDKINNIYDYLKETLPYKVIYLGRDEFVTIAVGELKEEVFLTLLECNKNLEQKLNYTFSAGIAEYLDRGEESIDFVRALEESLYKAKTKRNCIYFADETKMKLKSNYYTPVQLDRLANLSKSLNRSEASLLRESLDVLFRKYEN